MYSVILCGGSGTRLWPLSRKKFPKQFLKLYSNQSLLQETFLRMREIMPQENIYLVTSSEHSGYVVDQIIDVEENFKKENVLTEPKSLNTAPAIAYAMKHLCDVVGVDRNSPVIILPSDHYIGNKHKYLETVKVAMSEVAENIGTLGITPTGPETGYGYIRKGEKTGNFHKVAEFKEKPDKETARKYVDSGEYVWNSGMYIFKYETFLREVEKHAQDISALIKKDIKVFLENFESLQPISLDYAISEKSDKVVVFEGDFGWSDIGSFDSLSDILDQDNTDSSPKYLKIDSKNVFIHGTGKKLIVASGVEDLIIVESEDSILVQKKGKSEDVKKIVEHLKEHEINDKL